MKKENIVPLRKMVGSAAPGVYRRPVDGFSLLQLIMAIVLSAVVSALLTLHRTEVARLLSEKLHTGI